MNETRDPQLDANQITLKPFQDGKAKLILILQPKAYTCSVVIPSALSLSISAIHAFVQFLHGESPTERKIKQITTVCISN